MTMNTRTVSFKRSVFFPLLPSCMVSKLSHKYRNSYDLSLANLNSLLTSTVMPGAFPLGKMRVQLSLSVGILRYGATIYEDHTDLFTCLLVSHKKFCVYLYPIRSSVSILHLIRGTDSTQRKERSPLAVFSWSSISTD